MLKRFVGEKIVKWIESGTDALLITGARQIGKTFLIRELCKKSSYNFIEINFIDNPDIVKVLSGSTNTNDFLSRLSLIVNEKIIPTQTILFFDEIQVFKDLVTRIKFLVEDKTIKYIMSGSLLGVELNDLRSAPVGYLSIIDMYPMNFREFISAVGVSDNIIDDLNKCYNSNNNVDDFIHSKMIDLYYLYSIIGGMPEAVSQYIKTNDLKDVEDIHLKIIRLYKQDFTKYEKENKLKLREIYDLIPSELNKQNKRFIFTSLDKELRFDRYENNFLWLKDAGVALPIYNVNEPKIPLLLSKSNNLFKLFMSDVGLLNSYYSKDVKIKIFNKEEDINNGALFENIIAQELLYNNVTHFYYKSKKLGEVDFIAELNGEVVPIEVKSGKDYKRHNALNNLLTIDNYKIRKAIVLSNNNVSVENNVLYYPIYFSMFIKNNELKNTIIKIDLSKLS